MKTIVVPESWAVRYSPGKAAYFATEDAARVFYQAKLRLKYPPWFMSIRKGPALTWKNLLSKVWVATNGEEVFAIMAATVCTGHGTRRTYTLWKNGKRQERFSGLRAAMNFASAL